MQLESQVEAVPEYSGLETHHWHELPFTFTVRTTGQEDLGGSNQSMQNVETVSISSWCTWPPTTGLLYTGHSSSKIKPRLVPRCFLPHLAANRLISPCGTLGYHLFWRKKMTISTPWNPMLKRHHNICHGQHGWTWNAMNSEKKAT